jgi:hypothetical protein
LLAFYQILYWGGGGEGQLLRQGGVGSEGL